MPKKKSIQTKQKPMLSLPTIAEQLDISWWTVRKWIDSGVLKAVKLGRQYRVEEAELARFLKEREVK